jgi:hypothetical protein
MIQQELHRRLTIRDQMLLLVACGLCTAPAYAAGKVNIHVGQAEFAGLQIDGLDVGWTPAAGAGGGVTLRTARISGLASTGPLSALALDCPSLRVKGDQIHCDRGRLTGALGSLGGQDTRFNARTGTDGRLHVRLDEFAIAGGPARVNLVLDGTRWVLDAELAEADIAKAAVIARPWLELPEGFTVAGKGQGTVRASGRGAELRSADADLAIARLDFADATGMLAGEAILGVVRAHLESGRDGFTVTDGRLELAGGQTYVEPVFLDFGAHRADIDFSGHLDTEAARFDADRFVLVHEGVLQASGSAVLDMAGENLLPQARVRIEALHVAAALPTYLQPFLIDTSLKDLEGAGTIRGELDITGALPSRAALAFDGVILDNPTGSLALAGLRGQLNWYDDATRSALAGQIDDSLFQSLLTWDSASLWGIEIGAATLPFATTGRHFRLLEPTLLPIFDGGLAIGTLRLRHAGTEQMYVRFDAEVKPISVSKLSRALGWPEFQGTLSGEIPDVQLSQGVVTLGGNIHAAVFDGSVVIRDLSLRDPLGKFPRLFASIDVDNLDLARVTSTFSFGMITGRLSGQILGLETFNWMPESFDARFYTPVGDRSKHRISQRAVKNLSSIGGGSGGVIAAALQGGFLKFFEDFGYERLGLNCRLARDVCTMSGVERTNGGYYIVKGKGLPRINVIGGQSRVAWKRLMRQLATIAESEIVVE